MSTPCGLKECLYSWVNESVSADWRSVVRFSGDLSYPVLAFNAHGSLCSAQVETNVTPVCHVYICARPLCVCVYLSRCDGPSMQQGQQTAEGRGADGSCRTACPPHQVRKQDVTQELL